MRPARCPTVALAVALLAGCGGGSAWPPPKEVARWKVPEGARCLAFSPDGKHLAVGCGVPHLTAGADWEGAVEVYDLAADKQLARLTFSRWVRAVAFSPDGKYLAVGTGIKEFDVVAPPPGYGDKPGELVVYATGDYTEAFRHTAKAAPGAVRGVAFAPKGQAVYAVVPTGPRSDEARAWAVPGFKELWVAAKPQEREYADLVADPGGEKVYVADKGGAHIFAADTGRHLGRAQVGTWTSRLFVSADGKRLTSVRGNGSGEAVWWAEPPDGKAADYPPAPALSEPRRGWGPRVEAGAAAPDGRRVALTGPAVGGGEKTCYGGVWDVGTGARAYWEFEGVPYKFLAFSPDGKRLAACLAGLRPDDFAVVWEVPELK